MKTYYVTFILPGETAVIGRTVQLWDDYSTFADIPRILATTYYGQPERGTEIEIMGANQVQGE